MKEDARFAEAMAGLHEAAERRFVDEKLLVACSRFVDLWSKVDRLYREKKPGYAKLSEENYAEREALMHFIIKTHAYTVYGAQQKFAAVRCVVPEKGTIWEMVSSLVWDYSQLALRGLIPNES
jgi:hypothetical protein